MFGEKAQKPLEEKVVEAAAAALSAQRHVGFIEVLLGIGWLHPSHIEQWQRGLISCLLEFVQVRPERFGRAMEVFQAWAQARGLQAQERRFLPRTTGEAQPLRFTADADPAMERFLGTTYFDPELTAHQKQRLTAKLNKPPEIVVFWTVRDSKCAHCQSELLRGSFLVMEKGEPLCLACADLDHLVFLGRGDTALTRRARKHSRLSTVVVRFSRARKRYERQGVLVEESALKQAEEECLSDEDLRVRRREREAVRRQDEDVRLVERMAMAICELYPRCPAEEAYAIAQHTAARGSGRVGRSAAGQALDEGALRLATAAHARHQHTNYDDLLMEGLDRETARRQVRDAIERILAEWEKPKN